MNIGFTTSMVFAKKVSVQKTSTATAIPFVVVGALLTISSAHAAPEIAVNTSANSSTVVEQYSDGNAATTIITTPNSISMQDGVPATVSQTIITPSYVASPDASNAIATQSSTTPSNTSAQVLPTSTAAQLPVLNTSPAPAPTKLVVTNPAATNPVIVNKTMTNQVVLSQPWLDQPVVNQTTTSQVTPVTSTTSLSDLQLNSTFNTPDIVNAQTKIMKILKTEGGQEMAVPANHVSSGDIIEYHTTYTNTTDQPVNNLNAMVALPSGIQLLSLNSLLPTLATIDGNSYQTIQPMGNMSTSQVNYTGLKWNLVNLDANAIQTVVIRAKIQ